MNLWVFWAAAAALVIAVAATLLRAMRLARQDARAAADYDLAVYRDQLAEIERDMARGAVPEDEGARLRTEVQRRLLDTDRRARTARQSDAPRSTAPAMAAMLAVLLGAFGLYWHLGAPGYPDLPLAERLAMSDELRASRPSQAEAEAAQPARPPQTGVEPSFAELMDKLRAAVAERPGDQRGLELLARNEAALGNFIAAREAQQSLVTAKGEAATAADYAALAEIMVMAAGGRVTPESETALTEALTRDPGNGTARYYSGLMFAQIGRFDRAFVLWRGLLEDSAADAPWVAPIRAQIEDVAAKAGVNYTLPDAGVDRGPSAADIAAAAEMSAEDRQAMIEGMVAQLGARLAAEGGSAEDWARLITSLAQLGRQDEAREIFAEAQARFAGRSVDLAGITEAAVMAGVAEAGPVQP